MNKFAPTRRELERELRAFAAHLRKTGANPEKLRKLDTMISGNRMCNKVVDSDIAEHWFEVTLQIKADFTCQDHPRDWNWDEIIHMVGDDFNVPVILEMKKAPKERYR